MAKIFRLEILAPARSEIHEIARLHLELSGPASARKITDKIKRSLENLTTHPHMGAAFPDSVLKREGYRKLICGYYLCVYRLIGETVFVYHIIDGRTNYKMLLSNLNDS